MKKKIEIGLRLTLPFKNIFKNPNYVMKRKEKFDKINLNKFNKIIH